MLARTLFMPGVAVTNRTTNTITTKYARVQVESSKTEKSRNPRLTTTTAAALNAQHWPTTQRQLPRGRDHAAEDWLKFGAAAAISAPAEAKVERLD